jgi:hypothetical protein
VKAAALTVLGCLALAPCGVRPALDETLKVRGAKGVIRRNQQGLYGLLLENLTPFLLVEGLEPLPERGSASGILGAW